MIKPTIGRVMWYWPELDDRDDQPQCALVTWVHDDNLVNLCIFSADGFPGRACSVPIVQEGSPHVKGSSPYCEWMPFQVGQAKRHEAEAKTAS